MAKQSTTVTTRRHAPGARGGTPHRTTTAIKSKAPQSNVRFGIPLGKINLVGILVGIGLIVIGYLLMGTAIVPDDQVANNDGIWNNSSSVTFAPILLVIGYCIVIPIALLYRPKKNAEPDEETVASTQG